MVTPELHAEVYGSFPPRRVLESDARSVGCTKRAPATGHQKVMLGVWVMPGGHQKTMLRVWVSHTERAPESDARECRSHQEGTGKRCPRMSVTPRVHRKAMLRVWVTPTGHRKAMPRVWVTPSGHRKAMLRVWVTPTGHRKAMSGEWVTQRGHRKAMPENVGHTKRAQESDAQSVGHTKKARQRIEIRSLLLPSVSC